MYNIELDEEMEMPTPCQICGKWFDLIDGAISDKWYPNTTICEECGRNEQDEIWLDDEINELEDEIGSAEDTIKYNKNRLEEIRKTYPSLDSLTPPQEETK